MLYTDGGDAVPGNHGIHTGFGGLVGGGPFLETGSTNATKPSDLAGYFNAQSISVGVLQYGFGATSSVGKNSCGKEIDVVLFGYTPGVGALPFNYTNINTYTVIPGH